MSASATEAFIDLAQGEVAVIPDHLWAIKQSGLSRFLSVKMAQLWLVNKTVILLLQTNVMICLTCGPFQGQVCYRKCFHLPQACSDQNNCPFRAKWDDTRRVMSCLETFISWHLRDHPCVWFGGVCYFTIKIKGRIKPRRLYEGCVYEDMIHISFQEHVANSSLGWRKAFRWWIHWLAAKIIYKGQLAQLIEWATNHLVLRFYFSLYIVWCMESMLCCCFNHGTPYCHVGFLPVRHLLA